MTALVVAEETDGSLCIGNINDQRMFDGESRRQTTSDLTHHATPGIVPVFAAKIHFPISKACLASLGEAFGPVFIFGLIDITERLLCAYPSAQALPTERFHAVGECLQTFGRLTRERWEALGVHPYLAHP